MTKQAELPLEVGLIVDEFVERFESALASDGMVSLVDFLPPKDHPCYLEVASELVRVELEYRHEAGDEPRLQDYREMVPQVFGSKQHLQDVAFEDYRLRRNGGHATSTDDYRQQFNVDTAAWDAEAIGTDGVHSDSTVDRYCDRRLLTTLDSVDELPVVGEHFGEFELIDTLGRGTFAEVFLARQRGLANRLVAVKVSASLNGEADKLARLQHTNIVPIYSLHSHRGLNGVCMPYLGTATLADVLSELKLSRSTGECEVNGGSIADAVKSLKGGNSVAPGKVDASVDAFVGQTYAHSVAAVMERVAEGLAFAHQRGIVHRDVKPGNVLMALDGEPRLLDFNLSDDVVHDDPAHLFVGGTLPYMSPEQLKALDTGAISEPTSDVYSCGVMLYELLTLNSPFPIPYGSFDEVVDQMIVDHSVAPTSVSTHRPGLSPDFDSIISKCLHQSPQQRYPSAVEMAEDLRRHLDDLPLKHAANVSVSDRMKKWARRHPRISSATTVAAVATVCLATLMGVLFVRNSQLKSEQASTELLEFERDYSLVRTALSSPLASDSLRNTAIADGQELLGRYWDRDKNEMRSESSFAVLGGVEQESLTGQVGELETLLELVDSDSDASLTLPEKSNVYLQAVGAMRAHKYTRAKALLDQLRDADSSRPSLWLLSGNAMVGVGEHSRADSYYSVYIGLLPEHYVGYFYRGLCRFDQKDFNGSVADFSRVIDLRPDLSEGWLNRALSQMSRSDWEAARADLDKAIGLANVSSRAFSMRAKVLRQLGDHQRAAADLKTFLAKTPTDVDSWVERGTIQVRTSPQQALQDFEQALEIDPTNRRARNNSVYVLIEVLKEHEHALELLNRMLDIDPADDGAIAARAVLNARMGRREAAHGDTERLLKLQPSPKRVYQAASAFALTSRDNSEDAAVAIRQLSKAFRFDPGLLEIAKDDPDLESIRDSEEYQALAKTVADLVRQEQ